MKKTAMSGAQSTNEKSLNSKGSTKGIMKATASGVTPKTKGNMAKFAGGKKKVGK